MTWIFPCMSGFQHEALIPLLEVLSQIILPFIGTAGALAREEGGKVLKTKCVETVVFHGKGFQRWRFSPQ